MRMIWGGPGQRFYETGVDRGVLYTDGNPGVPWPGLVSVSESPTGGDSKQYYLDGIMYQNVPASEAFEATINAFYSPPEFGLCDGTAQVSGGLFATGQPRKSFGFSYRTNVGNDTDGPNRGYKIHLVYNALAEPSSRDNSTTDDSVNPTTYSWKITARPPAIAGFKRTAHFIVDSAKTTPSVLTALEDILYGSVIETPRLPDVAELVGLFVNGIGLEVIDHGDGTFTVNGPDDAITMLDSTTFEITWPSAIFIDADTYTISSL